MKLILKIANHSWIKGENARWSVAEGFDKRVLTWIKDRYAVLEREKPEFHEMQDKTVFLFYHDDKDIYDRNITEITAAVADCLFTNPAGIRETAEDCLKHKLLSDLEIAFSISSDEVVKSQSASRNASRQTNYGLAGFIMLLLIIGGIIFFFSDGEDTPANLEEEKVVVTVREPDTEPKFPNKSESADVEKSSEYVKNESLETAESTLENFCSKFNEIKSKEDDEQKTDRCFWEYIKDQCGGKERLPYSDKWVKKNSSVKCETIDPSDDEDLNSWKEKQSKEDWELIEKFFKRKQK